MVRPGRTPAERARLGTVTERLLGGRLFASGGPLRLGVAWCRSLYSRPAAPPSGIGFSGDRSELVGFDCTLHVERLTLLGEVARSGSRAVSAVAGVVLSPARGARASIAWRSSGPGFTNPRGTASAGSAAGGNEQGVRLALRATVARGISFEWDADAYRHPGPVVRDPLPSDGLTMGLHCRTEIDPAVSAQLRLRLRRWSETRAFPSVTGGDLRGRVEACRLSGSVLLRCTLAGAVCLRSQISCCTVRWSRALPETRAFLMSAGLQLGRGPRRGELRCTLFSGGTPDTPLVDAEPEPGLAGAAPLLYGCGARYIGTAEWELGSGFAFSGKCSVTFPQGGSQSASPASFRLSFSALASL